MGEGRPADAGVLIEAVAGIGLIQRRGRALIDLDQGAALNLAGGVVGKGPGRVMRSTDRLRAPTRKSS